MEMQQCILFIVVVCMSPTAGNTLESLCKSKYFLASFNQFWISLKSPIKNFMEISQLGAVPMHAGTGMRKLIDAFCNCMNAPKNQLITQMCPWCNKYSISWVFVLYSCLSSPACKSHLFCAVLYCHLWLVWLYHIFLHYFIKAQ